MGTIISTLGGKLTILITIVQGIITIMITNGLIKLIENGKGIIIKLLSNKIEIKNDTNLSYSIIQEIELNIDEDKLTIAEDYGEGVKYRLPHGFYKFEIDNETMYCDYQEKKIIIYKMIKIVWKTILPGIEKQNENIKKFIETSKKKHWVNNDAIHFYNIEDNKWKFPNIGRPTTFKEKNLTKTMINVLKDVKNFKSSEKKYNEMGITYRRGYMLYGIPGSGKTTIIELIARNYNMSTYNLSITSNDMTDGILLNLINEIPPNSLIVLEELDKQIDKIKNNINSQVSISGLLSSIDGPKRIAHGCIIICTSNRLNILEGTEQEALCRKGRFDMKYEFTEIINIEI